MHLLKIKRVIAAISICTGLMAAYSILNYFLYGSTLDISKNLIKKPLSLLGNILHAGLPIASQNIYNYFLLNKSIAVIFSIVLLVGFILFIIIKKIRWVNVLKLIIFTLVIFYPRILAVGSIRINGIIVFWVMIGLYLFLTNFNISERIINPIASIILALSIFTFILSANDNYNILSNYKKQGRELVKILNDNKNVMILSDQYPATLRPEIYYYRYNTFGEDSSFYVLPIFFDSELKNNFNFNEKLVEINNEGNKLKIHSLDPLVYLSYYREKVKDEGIRILKTLPSPSGREDSYLEVVLPGNYGHDLVFFNGGSWEKINLKHD